MHKVPQKFELVQSSPEAVYRNIENNKYHYWWNGKVSDDGFDSIELAVKGLEEFLTRDKR